MLIFAKYVIQKHVTPHPSDEFENVNNQLTFKMDDKFTKNCQNIT